MLRTEQPEGAGMAESLQLFRQCAPLIHCMTNDVVQNFTANVLLALNASPAMIIDMDETAQFGAVADALLINVGTLTTQRAGAMLAAVLAAREAGKPWVLDPVAVGMLTLRTAFCQQLLELQPAAIRANASEIMALTQPGESGRGVDSRHTPAQALAGARQLAQQTGAVVVITGEVDYVTDGTRLLAIAGGSALMTRIVGTGCALSAVVAGFCALPGDRLQHIASACRVVSCAGERAAQRVAGPGSFIPAFLDELWLLNAEALQCDVLMP